MNKINIEDILDKNNKFAVIGASNNEEKYGYKVYKQLKKNGYQIYPINPREELIDGDKCYETLYSIKEFNVDVLSFIVPPAISLKVTQTALKLGYKTFWYQPGSYNKEVLALHEGLDTKVVSDQCILIEMKN